MIRAIIFDFNGVIVDDETPHLRCFQQALAKHGLSLTKDEYYSTYLGMDERTWRRRSSPYATAPAIETCCRP